MNDMIATTRTEESTFKAQYTFPILNAKLGSAGTFWLYATICAAGFVFIKLKLPETKGKSLEQIERDLVD